MLVQHLVKKMDAEMSRWLHPHHPKHMDIIEKGHLIYMQGMVRSIRRSGNGLLADVQDVVPVQVRVNLQSIYDSECTCPAPFPCKHQIAVFFQLYGKNQSVHQWINRWKRTFPLDGKEDQEMNKGMLNMLEEKNQLTAEQEKVLSVYQHGVDLVEQTFHHAVKNRPDSFNLFYLYSKITNSLNDKGYYQWELTPLYHLVVNIHVLYRLVEFNQRQQRIWESKQLVHTILAQMDQAINELPKPAPFSFDFIYEKLVEDLRELLFLEEPFSNEMLTAYWKIWNFVFTRKTLRKRELAFAEETVKKSNPDSLWHVAYSFQSFFQGDMKKALDALESCAVEQFPVVFLYLEHFQQQKNWAGFDVIAPFFITHFKGYFESLGFFEKQNVVDQIFIYFSDYVEKTNQSHLMETILIQSLPFSAKPLSSFLLSRNEYRKLVELFLYANITIDAIGREVLKDIQRQDPESALPLYHRAVAIAISEKNRTSYKKAVRYLKKLRTIYRKLKEEERWNYYFSTILEETKRLRAFQEECRRGKLIDE
ncbi:SWIM zinc finger family protein [Fervidibacillus halotolerans]|uniref:SWIM zinc finger family protein n=1 Tax=Fervidibacillus halotolerans TaxID=2980027 RepID=A0A9E8LYK6_9BACI|nr:SWIM zinc finger family protein [Fervidibacillus halotolerans]WAA12143.1 SWIM zinc finger family protein [Fervidibacillus halotolerans]